MRQMVALPSGDQRGITDGHAVIHKPGTSIIIDATVRPGSASRMEVFTARAVAMPYHAP